MLAVEHVGITVESLDRSIQFYRELFGSEPLDRREWRGQSAEYVANMMGKPGLTLDGAWFRLPGSNAILEIIEFHDLADGEGSAARHYQTGGVHLGFYVENIDDAAERVRKAGAEFLTEPVAIEYGPYMGTGGRSVLFRDPDGNNLQLMEVSSRPGNLPLPSDDPPATPAGN